MWSAFINATGPLSDFTQSMHAEDTAVRSRLALILPGGLDVEEGPPVLCLPARSFPLAQALVKQLRLVVNLLRAELPAQHDARFTICVAPNTQLRQPALGQSVTRNNNRAVQELRLQLF